jgi:ABC-2 type transport system ATP-binding protein
VGLADALLHNPPVLILDEPTIGLDPTQIRETRSLIRELAQDHTVMLSSHILPEVEATCKRIVIINEGRIVASGTPAELRERIAGGSKLIAEFHGPEREIVAGLRKIDGVSGVESKSENGWTSVAVSTNSDSREQIFMLASENSWPLRELRRDVATLEDFFVKIVAGVRETAASPGDK